MQNLFFKNTLIFLFSGLLLSCGPDGPSSSPEFSPVDENGIFGGIDAHLSSKLSKKVLMLKAYIPMSRNQDILGSSDTFIGNAYCSATAVTRNIILTAAHCLMTEPGTAYQIEIQKPDGSVSAHKVIASFQHSKYKNGDPKYDIMLMRLAKDLPADIETVRLPEAYNFLKPTFVNVAGYGKTDGRLTSKEGVGKLRIATVPVLKYQAHSREFIVDSSRGQGSCGGDSGGPLFAYREGVDYQVGIVSRGNGKNPRDSSPHRNVCDGRTINVRVDYFLGWIKQGIEALK